jgi:hypothetical protein
LSLSIQCLRRRDSVKLRVSMLVYMLALFVVLLLIVQVRYASMSTNQVPVASFIYSPSAPAPGETITFDASSSYATGGTIVQYRWDFGDGTVVILTDPTATHVYPMDGNYTVELTVTDNSGTIGSSAAIIQVQTVVFFRVCLPGTLIPVPNVEVTCYYYNGAAWVKAPASKNGFEIKYDLMTQPHLASTNAERYRNPGYTAYILRHVASNVGFDLHPACWKVFFTFKFGNVVTYWPNETTTVYSYNYGAVEKHDYLPCHRAYWDSTAGTYVIEVDDIPGHGVSPSERHPIIVCFAAQPSGFCLNVNTDPVGIATISGAGTYTSGTNVTLNAPVYVNVSSTTRYRFSYWDVDGTSRGVGVNPITVLMTANHTATAHYILQYYLTDSSVYGSPSPSSGWFDSGTYISASVTSPVSGPAGTRYVCTGWTGTGSVPSSGSGTSVSFTITGSSSVTWLWKTQYYLTVFSPYGAIGGQGWYDSGASAYATVTPLTVSGGSGVQYVFDHWNGDATGSTSPSNAIVMTGPKTAKAVWKTQYYLTVSSVYGSPSPSSGWFDSGTLVNALVTSPYPGVAGVRYVCTGWSGTGSVPSSGSGTSIAFAITAPSSITWTWKTQYQVIFDQTGVGSDFTSAVVTIDGINYAVSQLPTTPPFWWDYGSSHTFSFASPLTVNGGKQYSWSTTSGLLSLQSGTLNVTASGSVTGNYIVQNQITFDQTGVGSDFTSAVVTIDGVNYTKSQLPVQFSWNLNTVHTFAFRSPLIVNGEKFVWTSTTGLSNMQSGFINVTAYGSVTGNYKTQYFLTVFSPYGAIGGQGWYDSGASAYATVTPLTVPGASETQYVFDHWNGDGTGNTSPSDPILMNGPKTATALWKTQYYLTVYSPYDPPTPVSGWFDSSTVINASVISPFPGPAGTQYVCTGWSGTGSVPLSGSGSSVIFTITGPSSITWLWKTQYYLTVFSPYGAIGGQGWYDSGTNAYATITPLTVPGASGTKYIFDHWNGDASGNTSPSNSVNMTSPKTATAIWKTQYYLTLATSPSGVNSPSGAGWYDAGSNATISTTAFVDIVPGSSRYRFNGWTTADMTEISDPLLSPTKVRMDKAKTVTANYVTQYSVTFGQSGVGSDFTGNITMIDISSYTFGALPHSFWWDSGSSHDFVFNYQLEVAFHAKEYVWANTTGLSNQETGTITVTASGTVTGNYKTLYYLTITSAYGSPMPTSGYISAGSVSAGVSQYVLGSTGTRYVCTGWSGTGSAPSSGGSSSVNFIINAPSSITWNWKTQYLLTVQTAPSDLDPQPLRSLGGDANSLNSWWYDASTSVTLTSEPVSGYTFTFWDVDMSSQGTGINPITVTMNGPHTTTAHYHALAVSPVGGYSFILTEPAQIGPMAGYAAILVIFGAVVTLFKRKRK